MHKCFCIRFVTKIEGIEEGEMQNWVRAKVEEEDGELAKIDGYNTRHDGKSQRFHEHHHAKPMPTHLYNTD